MKFQKLFEPVLIGSMEVKNRIVMPAMTTVFANENGAVTERLINYLKERAKGGVGLIITEATCIDYPTGRIAHPAQLRVDQDKFIPGLSDLVYALHKHDAKVALQLHHAGRQTTLEYTEGKTPVSASDVYDSTFDVIPRPLSIDEIESLVEKFGKAARRAKSAGFDAVEIHGAHGYLIQQFLSPYTNKRNDKYGGNLGRRMRFAIEILRCMREKVGDSFPIIYRLSAEEYVPNGLRLDHTLKIARRLEKEGADAIHISSGMAESPPEHCDVPPMAIPRGCFVKYAAAVKKVVKVPVITVGRINDPLFAEKILLEGKADLIAMGRALIADPELPKKAYEGRLDDIRKCVACNICTMRIGSGLRLGCTVNAAVGFEKETELRRADKSKLVIVIGGGPAGMEAARVAALRGHQVVLYEENDQLGGQLRYAIKPPYKEELKNLLEYLINQIKKLDVEVVLNKEVDVSLLQEIKPDTIIVATGAKPLIPKIHGIDNENVMTSWDVLAEKANVGNNIVIAGGGSVGCETAEFLAERGKKVTIIEMLPNIAIDAEPVTRKLLLKRLKEKSVKILTNNVIIEIRENEVITINTKNMVKETIKADNIVLALGSSSNNELFRKLKGKVKELYAVGDCIKPRKIIDAIHEGFHIAKEI